MLAIFSINARNYRGVWVVRISFTEKRNIVGGET